MEKIPAFAFPLAILVLLFGLAKQGNAGRTSRPFVFGNSNYAFHNTTREQLTWKESRKRCEDTRSDLVSIESLDEWNFLQKKINTTNTIQYFIGLKKNSSSKEWRWISDNSKVNATKGEFPWAKYEPNGDGNCAVMYKDYRGDDGEFKDLKCDVKYKDSGYICESPTNSNDDEVPTVQSTSYKTDGGSKRSGTKTTLRRSLAATSAARFTTSHSPSTEAPSKDPTRDPDEGKQAYEKDNCSLLVIILASLVGVLSVALLIFGVCFLSWRKKQRKDTSKATDTGNQLDNQDGPLLSPENAARQLGFSNEPEPHGIRLEYQRQGTDQDSRQEYEYTMLTPRTMMVSGDSSYASLAKSKQEECTNGSSAVASPLLQEDAEPHDELPTYINVHSGKHSDLNVNA